MPTESQNIDLYSANNDDRIVSLDTSNGDIASYTNTSLIVLLPMDVALTGQYYLLIEEGLIFSLIYMYNKTWQKWQKWQSLLGVNQIIGN